jgi:hypothetical protein
MSCGTKNSKTSPEVSDEPIIHLSPAAGIVDELLGRMDDLNSMDDSKIERPEALRPQTFIKDFHPSFKYLLKSPVAISKYTFIPFKKIPADVRDDILTMTKPDDEHTGYALLQKKTWRQLFDLQDKGYEIGLLESQPSIRITGIYSDQPKRIGLDVMAGEATLPHEERHAVQYRAIANTRTGKINGLDSVCYNRLARMFAETDAVAAELSSWRGVMSRVRFDEDWYWTDRDRLLSMSQPSQIYPFTAEFVTGMYYPVKVAGEVAYEPSCPKEVTDFANNLRGAMKQAIEPPEDGEIIDGLQTPALFLEGNKWKVYLTLQDYYRDCDVEGKSLSSRLTDDQCASSLRSAKEFRDFYVSVAANFEPELEKQIVSRPKTLRELYSKSPFFKDFCREMPGFGLNADCK